MRLLHRRLSTIASAYREAVDSWQKTKDIKLAKLAMINAEISNSGHVPKDILSRLCSEREALEADLGSREQDFHFNQEYRTNNVESVDMLKLREMSNQQYRKAFGAELLLQGSSFYKLFDDVLPDKWNSRYFTAATENLVNFSVAFDDVRSAFGNIISPTLTTKTPQIKMSIDGLNGNSPLRRYTFVLIDADLPLPQEKTLLSCPIWMTINIPVDSTGCKIEQGEDIIEYNAPYPARGSGFHRFVWLALEQHKQELCGADVEKLLIDSGWDSKVFLDKLDVTPKGLVFHRAAWDETVTDRFQRGVIRSPVRVIRANGFKIPENSPNQIKWGSEPVYGRPINQSWEQVNRNLYNRIEIANARQILQVTDSAQPSSSALSVVNHQPRSISLMQQISTQQRIIGNH